MTQKKASPQTQEELRIAKENLARELQEKNLTGVPSQDKAWTKNYTQEQLAIKVPKMSMFEYIYNRNINNMSVNAFNYYMGKKIHMKRCFIG